MSEPYWEPLAAAPPIAVGYGTTLPASPADGQEYILVDSLTNPTYQWRFRYNADRVSVQMGVRRRLDAAGAVTTQENTSSATFVALATPGPQMTLPRAGEYDFRWGAIAYNTSGSASTGTQMTLYLNGSPTAQTMFSGVGFYHHGSRTR